MVQAMMLECNFDSLNCSIGETLPREERPRNKSSKHDAALRVQGLKYEGFKSQIPLRF